MAKLVYLGLGSNIGDRLEYLKRAIERLSKARVRVLRASPVYETEPLDATAQGWFLNQVVEAETELFPLQLLAATQRIERELGRARLVPKGPRTLDIDILFYGKAVVETERLEIPHPRVGERRFVLKPLADLAAGFRHPATGRSVREMLDTAPEAAVRLLHS
ncbi:MAG: 2-amino-4-hydroxy-6-hydroxymethyldihydropteridine diphosphokinase [Bryobacteraceae bacterium]|jgi:2-amino-4-hydroxy-6-hydroxymethyldihydropteridine diphosphokinase